MAEPLHLLVGQHRVRQFQLSAMFRGLGEQVLLPSSSAEVSEPFIVEPIAGNEPLQFRIGLKRYESGNRFGVRA